MGNLFGAKTQARAAKAAAAETAEATRVSSEAASKATRESAAQATRQQEANAARNAAVSAASDALSVPLESPDVLLDESSSASSAGTARKRRSSFGVGYNSGVNI